MIKKIIIGLLIFMLVIQVFRIDKVNPTIKPQNDILNLYDASSQVRSSLKSACYDCHSNETKYPWYTNVAPISWWIKDHINEGREHLNFSEWGSYEPLTQKKSSEEVLKSLKEGWMPMGSYVEQHPEASLSKADKEALERWFTEINKK